MASTPGCLVLHHCAEGSLDASLPGMTLALAHGKHVPLQAMAHVSNTGQECQSQALLHLF